MAIATDVGAYERLLTTYFPSEQVANAGCVLARELATSGQDCAGADPADCLRSAPGPAPCPRGAVPGPTTASGLFGILERCWSPEAQGDNTPFTADDWANRFGDEPNVWMASVVWSIGGWRAWPTSCAACGICDVEGEPVPHPRNPVRVRGDAAFLGVPFLPLVGTLGVVGALAGLAYLESTGGRL